jgi:hypothetical protein
MNAKQKAKELILKFSDSVHPQVLALICIDEQIRLILQVLDGDEQETIVDYLIEVKEEIVNYEYQFK